jgi:dihydrofolate synthase/folylpolyglutamate synthase
LQSVFSVDQNQHAQGIEKTKLPARLQVKTINDKTVILDVAHNAAAVQTLADELNKNRQPTVAIFSALQDKNIKSMIRIITPLIDEWLLPPLQVNRAIAMQDLTQKFSLSSKIKVCNDMPSAIHQAFNTRQVGRIVIFGSFHIVADALKVLE